MKNLEDGIPKGYWCHGNHNESCKPGWCKYHEIQKPFINKNGLIKSYYCNMLEEYVERKECGLNE